MSFDFSPKDRATTSFFSPSEKRRFGGMVAASLLLMGGLLYMAMSTNRHKANRLEQAPQGPTQPEFVESVEQLKIDVPRWNELTSDKTTEDRVLVESAALKLALESAQLIRDAHFEAMNGIEPTLEQLAEIARDPSASRARFARLRGTLEQLEEVPSVPGAEGYWRGRMRLENQGVVLFAAPKVAENGVYEGVFARMDGLFLKLMRHQTDSGWIEAPLFVGPTVRRSFARIEPVSAFESGTFMGVVDDTLDEPQGMQLEEYWKLVSYVSNLPASDVDWGQAPLLNRQTMTELMADGSKFRARPVRIPACTVLDVWSQAQGENPLRVAKMSEGWLGLQEWIGPSNGVVHFSAPNPELGLKRGDLVTANAYFFKNHAYETDRDALAVAPFMVVTSMALSLPPDQSSWRLMLAIFGSSLIGLIGLLLYLSRRDRLRSENLEAELRNRRRTRRAVSKA